MAKLPAAPTKQPLSTILNNNGQSQEIRVDFIWEKWFSQLLAFLNLATPRPYAIRSTAVDDELDPRTDCILIVDSTAGNRAIAVPSQTVIETGQPFCVKKTVLANTVTLTPTDGKTIDGAASLVLTGLNEVKWIVADGANWQVI